MKYFIFLIILSSLGFLTKGYPVVGHKNHCDSVYYIVEQQPIYKSGMEDFYKQVGKKIRIIDSCKTWELKRIEWTITTEGEMIDFDIIGLQKECKDDIIEQLKTLSGWMPGKTDGKAVCVRMILPLHIRHYE